MTTYWCYETWNYIYMYSLTWHNLFTKTRKKLLIIHDPCNKITSTGILSWVSEGHDADVLSLGSQTDTVYLHWSFRCRGSENLQSKDDRYNKCAYYYECIKPGKEATLLKFFTPLVNRSQSLCFKEVSFS